METMDVDVQFQNYFESDMEQTQEQNLERLYANVDFYQDNEVRNLKMSEDTIALDDFQLQSYLQK